jgi:poly(3-hydroxybutyrate) depolymerase
MLLPFRPHPHATIAPVADTIAIDDSKPKRPVPVLHFHGSKDNIVPFEMAKGKAPAVMKLKGVEESVQTWVKPDYADTVAKDGALVVTVGTAVGGK